MGAKGQSEPRNARRGFAAMDATKHREIARKGGRTAHARGRAHVFTPDEARVAGSKGGKMVSQDHEHMVAIGRLGGQARARTQTGSPTDASPTTQQRLQGSPFRT